MRRNYVSSFCVGLSPVPFSAPITIITLMIYFTRRVDLESNLEILRTLTIRLQGVETNYRAYKLRSLLW